MNGMYIGILSKKVGLDAPTIRYYEKEGLLQSPVRSSGGYRLYSDEDLETIQFIRMAQGLGLTLREIKKIVNAREIKGKACDHVAELLQNKIGEFNKKAKELKRVSRLFQNLLNEWNNKKNKRKTCICDDLAQESKRHK